MKSLVLGAFASMLTTLALCQNLNQTVRGKIVDIDSKLPLIGATIRIQDSDPIIGTITDVEGNFRLERVPTGRITLQVSYMGYEPKLIPNVIVNSGKEVVLDIPVQESAVKMDELVITANRSNGEALNDMAMISARSVSPEQTNRYAGGFNDPSKIVSNFAGVTATQDGSNDIIVRGNAPKYVQWRLEGVQISNPNHFADQSSAGGAISTLNNNMLATSDFYTGAFTAEYGDVLSGVYDVKLRSGNNEKMESVFGFGLLGTDFTLEGPLKKGYGGSYIVNYRYATVAIISDLGLIDISGIPKFQDAAFKIVLPTAKAGTFSIFGLGGYSTFLFEDIKPDIWNTPGDQAMRTEISEDYQKQSYLANTGINHTYTINPNSYVTTTLAFSAEGIEDDIFESRLVKIYDEDGQFVRDSTASRIGNFTGSMIRSTYRGAMTYSTKLNARHKMQVGTTYNLTHLDFTQSQFENDPSDRATLVDFDNQIGTLRNFVSWKYRAGDRLTFVSGLHNMNVLFNNKSTLEPRAAVSWQVSPANAVNVGYGMHSTMESLHNYFTKVEQPDGSIAEPNRDLDLLKAHHFVVGYTRELGRNLVAKAEVYYQALYDLPVENLDTSNYATINEGLEFRYVELVNKGTGRNYGIELTIERSFSKNYYFLINGSLYESKYTALDGIERNTRYNGNYLINALAGKEFDHLGKKNNQTLALNTKIFFGGGPKVIPLLRDEQGNLAVDPENNQFWDYEIAYERDLEDVYSVTISASYKWNKPKATHELFVNLDNVTNTKGKISEYYDADEPDLIGHTAQFGFFPNLMYRVYF